VIYNARALSSPRVELGTPDFEFESRRTEQITEKLARTDYLSCPCADFIMVIYNASALSSPRAELGTPNFEFESCRTEQPPRNRQERTGKQPKRKGKHEGKNAESSDSHPYDPRH